MLPLGLRVQEKLERLIDKHMRSVGVYRLITLREDSFIDLVPGASKVSLSSISSQELWEQSGRLKEGSEVNLVHLYSIVHTNSNIQVFRFLDRKESRFLLAPTHEEEITTLVGSLTKSYRDLPLRVYQVCK